MHQPSDQSDHDGTPFSIGAFTVSNARIIEISFLADPARIVRLDLQSAFGA
jgi:hypothetical protein